jgi:hypothetical protein
MEAQLTNSCSESAVLKILLAIHYPPSHRARARCTIEIMLKSRRRSARRTTVLVLGLLGQLMCGMASADESAASDANRQQAAGPLWLPKTRADWDSIVSQAQLSARHRGTDFDVQLEEVTVTAPAELLPMHENVYDEMWGGILAPVWALMHPTQAWRIFLPTPPN